MAKNTKGDGSLDQNGSTVVTPDNMGKGLAYNSQTNQYDVSVKDSNGVKVNPDGSVGLALSPDAGNQIELRDNGIYLGTQAVQQDFYVDAINGNDDTGNGSYSEPYRTLNKVLSVLPTQKLNLKIYLKEKQTHVCNLTAYTISSDFTVGAYGDEYTALHAKYSSNENGKHEGSWQLEETIEYHQIAPKLQLTVSQQAWHAGVSGAKNQLIWLEKGTLRFNGIHFTYSDPNRYGIPPNQQWRNVFGGYAGHIYFFDCDLDNSETGQQWNLFSEHDGSVMFKVWNLTTKNKANQIGHIGAKMQIEFVGDNTFADQELGNGLHRRGNLCTPKELIDMIAGKGGPLKANYNNLDVNY